jgi:segregation and condensation protein B
LESERAVEAVLFSSGRPMKASELCEATGLGPDTVRRALKRLEEEYDQRGSAIQVVKIGLKYSMQLRPEAARYSTTFAEKELPDKVLRLAAIIAYNQPILQSELAKLMGSDVYDEVRTLRHAGLVTGKRQGQTLLLSTTQKFSEYFGIGSNRKEDIKRWLESQSKK